MRKKPKKFNDTENTYFCTTTMLIFFLTFLAGFSFIDQIRIVYIYLKFGLSEEYILGLMYIIFIYYDKDITD